MPSSGQSGYTTGRCPFTFSTVFGGGKSDKEKVVDFVRFENLLIYLETKGTQSKSNTHKKGSRKFPWVAFGGLTIVTLLGLTSLWLTISLLFRFSSIFFFIISLPFRGLGAVLSPLFWWSLQFLLSFTGSSGLSSSYSPALAGPLYCNNSMELQPWEVLNFVPGRDGNPKSVQYQLNSPTPHAISIIDIDYRDTRLDVFANGKYYGSTSDFSLDKSVYCGEDLNACIRDGFSMGTVIIPAGKKSVEITWSGKDVFPGTDKIVWGGDRKRRVMWKKDLCI